MRAYRAATLDKLHEQVCRKLVHATADELDVITSVDVQIHNVVAEAQSMEWNFNLKNMWLTPSRWTMMVNQYIDPEALTAWIEKCTGLIGTKGRGIATMRTKDVKPRGGPAQGNKETRRWGSCMLALSYKALPRPQITLYSRTSYLGYIGALDLSVAWMCGRYLAKELGIEVEEMAFVWFNEAMQWHNFKSLAFMLNHTEDDKRHYYRLLLMKSKKWLEEERMWHVVEASPALRLSRNWLQKLLREDRDGVTYGDMSYNTYRRIRRRFHTEVRGFEHAKKFEGWSHYKVGDRAGEQKEFFKAYGPLPDTYIFDLDFAKIGLPLTGQYGVAYDDALAAQEEDDDD